MFRPFLIGHYQDKRK